MQISELIPLALRMIDAFSSSFARDLDRKLGGRCSDRAREHRTHAAGADEAFDLVLTE
jgi:hypothetical protein